VVQAAHCVCLGRGDFVTVGLFLTRGTGVATVHGMTMSPTVGSGFGSSWQQSSARCAWMASTVAWTGAIASACSVGGGMVAAGAKSVVGIAAVAFPAWNTAWLEVVSSEERSCSAPVNSA